MGVGISVKVDLKGIENKVSPTALAKGKLAIASQMKKDMARFIPIKSGDLRGSAQVLKDSIRYPGPYARAQFYGGAYNKKRSWHWSKGKMAGTGPRWDKKASAIHVKDWGKVGLRATGVKA
jgi:putative minor capsid protein